MKTLFTVFEGLLFGKKCKFDKKQWTQALREKLKTPEYLKKEKSFFDEIKNIFYSF